MLLGPPDTEPWLLQIRPALTPRATGFTQLIHSQQINCIRRLPPPEFAPNSAVAEFGINIRPNREHPIWVRIRPPLKGEVQAGAGFRLVAKQVLMSISETKRWTSSEALIALRRGANRHAAQYRRCSGTRESAKKAASGDPEAAFVHLDGRPKNGLAARIRGFAPPAYSGWINSPDIQQPVRSAADRTA